MENDCSHVYLCKTCDKCVCDSSYSCKVYNKSKIFMSGILDGVQLLNDKKKILLVCVCGECIGEYNHKKKDWKYCLYLDKLRKVISEQDQETTSSHRGAISKKRGETNSGKETSEVCSSSCSETDTRTEITRLKTTIISLEERMKTMESVNTEKSKDLCKIVIQQKMEILRLQEIVWALHPNVNLEPAFTVFQKMEDVRLNDPGFLNADDD